MVADHDRDVDRELAPPRAREQVDEAVRLLRDEDADAVDARRRSARRTACRTARSARCERGLDLVASQVAAVELELDPLEEHAVGAVGVLLRVEDVAAVPVHEVGDGGDDPRAGRGTRAGAPPVGPSTPFSPNDA